MQDKSTIFCYEVMTDVNLFYSLKGLVYMYMCPCVVSHFNCIRLFATLWTVATRLHYPWDSPGKNTRVDCHTLLRGSSHPRDQNCVSCIYTIYVYIHIYIHTHTHTYIYIYIKWPEHNFSFSLPEHYTKAAGEIKTKEKKKKKKEETN